MSHNKVCRLSIKRRPRELGSEGKTAEPLGATRGWLQKGVDPPTNSDPKRYSRESLVQNTVWPLSVVLALLLRVSRNFRVFLVS